LFLSPSEKSKVEDFSLQNILVSNPDVKIVLIDLMAITQLASLKYSETAEAMSVVFPPSATLNVNYVALLTSPRAQGLTVNDIISHDDDHVNNDNETNDVDKSSHDKDKDDSLKDKDDVLKIESLSSTQNMISDASLLLSNSSDLQLANSSNDLSALLRNANDSSFSSIENSVSSSSSSSISPTSAFNNIAEGSKNQIIDSGLEGSENEALQYDAKMVKTADEDIPALGNSGNQDPASFYDNRMEDNSQKDLSLSPVSQETVSKKDAEAEPQQELQQNDLASGSSNDE